MDKRNNGNKQISNDASVGRLEIMDFWNDFKFNCYKKVIYLKIIELLLNLILVYVN